MHGGAHGKHDIADILWDSNPVAGLCIYRKGRNGTLGCERGNRRIQDMPKHPADPCFAACEICIGRKRGKEV